MADDTRQPIVPALEDDDGVPDASDKCSVADGPTNTRNNPYGVESDGCRRWGFGLSPSWPNLSALSKDRKFVSGCGPLRGQDCRVTVTLTASKGTVRKLGLKKATFGRYDVKFPSSLPDDKLRKSENFGFSKSVRRKLKAAKSATFTIKAKGTLGNEVVRLRPLTITVTRKRLVGDKSFGNGNVILQYRQLRTRQSPNPDRR